MERFTKEEKVILESNPNIQAVSRMQFIAPENQEHEILPRYR